MGAQMRIPRLTMASGLAFIVVAFVDRTLIAADLDRSFGSGGKVITDVSGRFDEIRAIVIQPDGRIVAVGVTGTAPDRDFALARYDADGSLDRSFGVSGTVVTDFQRGDDLALAVTVQSDGKLVAGGTASGDVALARYNPDGTLDRSFGTSGAITLDFGGDDRALALSIQRDTKIVVAGVAGGRDFAIARLDPNGQPDPTFGVTGRLTTDFSGNPDVAYAIAIRPDSRIIAVGYTGGFPLAQFAVAQYYADGSADSSFGVEGKATVGFGRDARAHGVTLGNEGEITVGGFMNNGSSTDAVFARLTPDGGLDTSFGVAGRVLTDFGGRNFASALAF